MRARTGGRPQWILPALLVATTGAAPLATGPVPALQDSAPAATPSRLSPLSPLRPPGDQWWWDGFRPPGMNDVVFAVSYLSPTLAHELLAYTWIFRNVRASGHWWYAGIPGLIEGDLRCRIEALPKTKLLGYYSDAYYVELALPKLDMYRWCLARVLAGQVEMKRLSEAEALDVARHLLRDNAREVFGV